LEARVSLSKVADWFGIVTSAVAFWLASAELCNDIIGGGKDIIPLGHFDLNKFPLHGVFHVPGRIHGVTHGAVLFDSRYGPRQGEESISERNYPSSNHIAILSGGDLELGSDHIIGINDSDPTK